MTTISGLGSAQRALLGTAEAAEAQGQIATARNQYERLLVSLPRDADPATASMIMRRMARCYIEEADFEAALDCLMAARETALAHSDTVGVTHATNLQAIAAQQRGDLDAAQRLYHDARIQAIAAGAWALVAMIDQNLGTVANIRGDLVEARDHYLASLAGYQELRLEQPISALLNNLGMLHADLREWQKAEDAFVRALRIATANGDVPGQLRAQANRVELYIGQNRYRKARQLCRRILSAARSCDGQWVGETWKHLGVIARDTGDHSHAEVAFQSALRIATQRRDVLLEAETLREIGTMYHRMGRAPETFAALSRSHTLFTNLAARHDLSDVDRQLRRLESEFLEIVRRWGASIESTDKYTQGHCERVADVACLLARDAGIPASAELWFRMGALLHDVGKIRTPLAVLNKPGKLTAEELAVIRQHPVDGEALLAKTEFPWDIRPMVRHHHEHWDGTGYPDRLAGENIPLAARILCIADVYDALTSTRAYRLAHTHDEALEIMKRESGRTFDPALLDLFIRNTAPVLADPRERNAIAPEPLVGREERERTAA